MINGKLICLVGQTASGKDTIANYLRDTYGYKQVCSYTTRPKRPNETNGVEHYFISDEEMEKLRYDRDVVAYTRIDSELEATKGFEYCAKLKDVLTADVYIIDPNGIKYMREKFPDIQIITVFVDADEQVRKVRALKRDPKGLSAFEKRERNEYEQFRDFKKSKSYDYIIETNAGGVSIMCGAMDAVLIANKFI